MGDSSTTEAELEAFEAMAEYIPWVKAAIEAYGFYQKFLSLGSVKRQLSLQDIITRSENRIIAAIKTSEMTQCINNLRAVASSWENTCEPFLESNPISPDTVSAFEHAITVQTVNDKITVAIGVVEFFSKNDKQEYVSFEAITTAITLLFSLLTVRETYFIAAENHKMDTAILSKQVQRAIDVMQAWPDKYINRRVDYLSVEIEQKYSGRADPLGGGRQKHPTGWYTLHDSAPDPATGNFEGFRVNYFPNRLAEVKKRFQQSKLATEILPKLLANWAALKATALVSEAFPLPAASPHTWLRLSSLSSPSMNLDVANDPNGVSNDAQLQLTRQGNYSGQFWHVRPSDTSPGRWNLCSLFLGRGMCLDVYGNNKTLPHLTTAGNYSGQQWQLIKKPLHHAWSFSNAYSGDDMVLSTVTNPDGSIKLTVESRDDEKMAQMWVVTAIRPITEPGY